MIYISSDNQYHIRIRPHVHDSSKYQLISIYILTTHVYSSGWSIYIYSSGSGYSFTTPLSQFQYDRIEDFVGQVAFALPWRAAIGSRGCHIRVALYRVVSLCVRVVYSHKQHCGL